MRQSPPFPFRVNKPFAVGAGILFALTGTALIYSWWPVEAASIADSTSALNLKAEQPSTGQDSARTEPGGKYFVDDAAVKAALQEERRRTSVSPASAGGPSQEVEEVIPAWPVAMQARIPESSPEIGPDQIQAIRAVSQSFTRAMQSAGNPSSPEYLERWIAEQERADELLMAYLGADAFNLIHRPEEQAFSEIK